MELKKTPIAHLVIAQTPDIIQQLQWSGFRRADIKLTTAASGSELLEHVRKLKPRAIILDTSFSDYDPFTLSQKIKDEMDHYESTIVIHSQSAISRADHQKLVDSRCDELLIGPLSRGQIYEALAPHLNLDMRTEPRIKVTADARVDFDGTVGRGRIFDLTSQGARISIQGSLKISDTCDCTISSPSHGQTKVKARVVWHTERGQDTDIALQFIDAESSSLKTLEQLVTWEVDQSSSETIVRIFSGFTERSNFGGLITLLPDETIFDLGNVQTITSNGTQLWVEFIRSIPSQRAFTLRRCSTVFCTQANYVTDMLGHGRIESVFAPYYSSTHDYEAERELSVESMGRTFPPTPPDLPCPLGGVMSFDDLPDRYFGFLKAQFLDTAS